MRRNRTYKARAGNLRKPAGVDGQEDLRYKRVGFIASEIKLLDGVQSFNASLPPCHIPLCCSIAPFTLKVTLQAQLQISCSSNECKCQSF